MTTPDFDRALATFAHGFAFTRSFTHPYVVEQLSERVCVLRDAPRKRGDYRREEVVASGVPVATVDALAREQARERFVVCYVLPTGESDADLRADFKALGYRLTATEALMIHRLGPIGETEAPYSLARVTTGEQAVRLAKAAGRRQILAEHLNAQPAPMRQYMTLDGDAPVGWAGSVAVGDCGWCTNVFVEPAYRRQGVARALLARLLADERNAGFSANVLLASHAGSKLYPTVGYETLGALYLYTPPKERPQSLPEA